MNVFILFQVFADFLLRITDACAQPEIHHYATHGGHRTVFSTSGVGGRVGLVIDEPHTRIHYTHQFEGEYTDGYRSGYAAEKHAIENGLGPADDIEWGTDPFAVGWADGIQAARKAAWLKGLVQARRAYQRAIEFGPLPFEDHDTDPGPSAHLAMDGVTAMQWVLGANRHN
jgi:hypothetical protein